MIRDTFALAFAMTFPLAMAWLYFIVLEPAPASEQAPSSAVQIAYFGGKVVQFGFPLVFLGWYEPKRLRPTLPSLRGVEWGLAFGLGVGAAILALHNVLHEQFVRLGTTAAVREKLAEFNAHTPARFFLMAFFLTAIHSWLEEFYWRWFVFGRLQPLVGLGWAIVLSSLAFTAHHVVILYVYLPGQVLAGVIPSSLCIAVGGGVWAWLFHRTGSLCTPWLSHLLVDAAIMIVGHRLAFAT